MTISFKRRRKSLGPSDASPAPRGRYIPTLTPIAVLDLELADGPIADIPVSAEYRSARVLVRLHGAPLGVLEMSVRRDRVLASDLRRAVVDELCGPLACEGIRRRLLGGGLGFALDMESLFREQPAATIPEARLSIIVCTRDRPDDLAICLAAISRLDYDNFEVVVVDNAPSSSASRDLVTELYPDINYVREERPGLDYARNRGILEASGEILAFTDDDVVVDPRWLSALAAVFAGDATVGMVTGLIEPFEQETEAQALFEEYGGFGRGYQRHFVSSPAGAPVPWHLVGAGQMGAGANMAFRRNVFEEIGLFDPALDVGSAARGGGDHDIFFRAIRSGTLCVYAPEALVKHRHRRSLFSLRRLMFDYGYGTRCFLEREAQAFPDNVRQVKRLMRWWWRYWAARRWWRSVWKPTAFPRELVESEIKGFVQGRGVYARGPSDGMHAPDEFGVGRDEALNATELAVGVVSIDVAAPLRDLVEGEAYDELEILVCWRGAPCGRVRVVSRRRIVSAYQLSARIAQELWPILLRTARLELGYTVGDSLAKWRIELERQLLKGVTLGAQPMVEGSATIIVATCNRADELRRCLTSLVAQETSRSVQIVVVDNRPPSTAVQEVVAEFEGVDLVEEPRPGSSYARNAGIAVARGEFIAITDDDMVVATDWLERLLEPFSRSEVMAVTGITFPATLQTEAERVFEAYGGFGRGVESRQFDRKWLCRSKWRSARTWTIGGSGNSAYRAEVFADPAIGPMDERLGAGVPAGVGEDTLLFYDILHAGFRIVYWPKAVAWHFHRVDRASLKRQIFAYSKGHVAYHLLTYLKHGDGRGLFRIVVELPWELLRRVRRRLKGKSKYPWSLLLLEAWGSLLGPWALWRSVRLRKQRGPGARLDPSRLRRGTPAVALGVER